MGVWDRIEYLIGQSLKTLEQNQPFEIMEITPSDIQICIYSTLETRRIKRGILEGIWMQLISDGCIEESEIRENYSSSNAAFISAILASMPNVTYRLDPLQLSVTTPKH